MSSAHRSSFFNRSDHAITNSLLSTHVNYVRWVGPISYYVVGLFLLSPEDSKGYTELLVLCFYEYTQDTRGYNNNSI